MVKKIGAICIMIISVITSLFMMICGKALFWISVIAAKIGDAILGGTLSILAWAILIVGLFSGSILYGSEVIDKKVDEFIENLDEFDGIE